MGFLLLAIFCSAMISITMRLSSGKVGSHFSMLAANYLVCGILGAVYADFSLLATETDGIGLTVGLAVLNGAMLLGGLILLLLLNGGVDTAIKTFEALGPAALSDHFLCFSFSVAFVLCMGLVLAKRERPDGKALLYGAAIGVVNFFSSKFVLGALTQIPAVVLFPTYSVATMLVVTLCGVLFFKERLTKRQWLAFGGVIAALIMLNI